MQQPFSPSFTEAQSGHWSRGNTLPLTTYHQMFGNTPTNKILPVQSQSHRFYAVDVLAPAIHGLHPC